jgi:hypothetical protein
MLHSKQLRSIKMLVDSNHGIYRDLSDPEKPPLEHGLTATEGRSARCLIPFEAKAPQPIPDIHDGVLIPRWFFTIAALRWRRRV